MPRGCQFGRDRPSIQILHYDGVVEGCRAFCSLGLTHYRDDVGGAAEIFAAADEGWDDLPRILANCLFYIVQNRMTLGWGLSIGVEAIAPEFAKRFNKSAVYFTMPFNVPEAFGRVECGDTIGRVWLATFISQSEHRFFMDKGADELERTFSAKGVDPYELRRPQAI